MLEGCDVLEYWYWLQLSIGILRLVGVYAISMKDEETILGLMGFQP